MTLPIVLAPATTFLAFVALATGIHWLSINHGDVAKRRLSVFAPADEKATTTVAPASTLLSPRSFSAIPHLQQFLQREHWGERLTEELARAGISLSAGEYLLLRWVGALLAGCIALFASAAFIIAAAVALFAYLAPALYVRWRQRRRRAQFDEQLVDALVLISSALKSGFSFLQAMQSVAEQMPDPMGVEFRQALLEARMGGAVDEAIGKIAKRVRSADFELVIAAVVIQRQVGGNLTEIINNVVRTVRDRRRIQREVRTLTGEPRMEGAVLAVLPLGLAIVLLLVQPAYLSGMWAANAGRLMLAIGLVMDILGLLVIRKMIDIEV